jgi:hypothetical protein
MLKYKYPAPDQLPAEHQGLYAERDGAWVLAVEGAADQAELEASRAQNLTLGHQVEELEKQLAGLDPGAVQRLTTERDALHGRLAQVQINQGALASAARRGLKPTAGADLAARARAVFRLEDGIPKAYEPDGQTPKLGRDGVSPLTLDEWVEGLAAEAPHLFAENSGGGAHGGNAHAGGAFGDNPWKRETFNLTRQGEIMRKDPTRARALMSAANNA